MNRLPGLFVIAFASLALAGFGLWPASAPAQKSMSSVNVYFSAPQNNAESESSTDSEAALDQELFDHEEEGNDNALHDNGYPITI